MSEAYGKFRAHTDEIVHLFEIHGDITERNVGRPEEKVAVLNKAGYVLVCAFWQAYCEDVLFEIMLALADKEEEHLPDGLKVAIANRILGDRKNAQPQELWRLAGTGWREELRALVKHLKDDKNRPLDSPSSENVEAAFAKYVGVSHLRDVWFWPKMSKVQAAKKLDDAIKVRHRLAHRGANEVATRKVDVENFLNHVERLAEKTENKLLADGLI